MFRRDFFLISNVRYTDCLSLTYATSKSKKLKLHYKQCFKAEKHIKNHKNNFQSKYKSRNYKE